MKNRIVEQKHTTCF